MKRNILILFAIILGSGLMNSCTHFDDDLEGGALIKENAVLYLNDNNNLQEVNPMKLNEISLADTAMSPIHKSFIVKLNKPCNDKDLELSLVYSQEKTIEYMNSLNLNGELLNSSFLSYDENISIEKGRMKSNPINLKINIDTNLVLGHTYYFSLSLVNKSNLSANSVCLKNLKIFPTNSIVLFSVVRQAFGQDILKVIELKRDVYLAPIKILPDLKHDITVECLVNVHKFRGSGDPGEAGISTLMGIEGESLMRFGDAGVPPNYLQVNGQKINFPFSTNKWYHIAEVYNAEKGILSLYINGNLITSFATYFTIHSSNWFIGRSWSDGRGIDAQLSEFRIWSEARTAEDLKDNMFNVKSNSNNLEVYWKMDQAKGNIVLDATGHGYDIKQKRQPGGDNKDISIIKLRDALTID